MVREQVWRDPEAPGEDLRRHVIVMHRVDNCEACRVTQCGVNSCPRFALRDRTRRHYFHVH